MRAKFFALSLGLMAIAIISVAQVVKQHSNQGLRGFAPPTLDLSAKLSKTNLPDSKTFEVFVPHDRCKPGRIVFAGKDKTVMECPILARGGSSFSKPPVPESMISKVTDSKNTPWKVGKTTDGKDCWYKNTWVESGATPAPRSGYNLWLDESRPAEVYGKYRISCLDFINSAENVGDRSDLRIHSGREHKEFNNRYTHGCLRIDPSCQQVLNKAIISLVGTQPSCALPPENKRLKLKIVESP